MLGDSGHVLFDTHGCGKDRRRELDAAINSGKMSFREGSNKMWGSLKVPFDEGLEVMKNELKMDPGFLAFHSFCLRRTIPFTIISAGLKPVLQGILEEFLGPEQAKHVDIISNDAVISDNGNEWKVVWKDNTALGHDKAASIQEAKERACQESHYDQPPLVIFIGDGISDLAAARECDVLFARRGLRLEQHCIEHGIKYVAYDSFVDIHCKVERILKNDERRKRKDVVSKYFHTRYNPLR
jgi:2,3-diketo-5-methylthio-1-phosphopentane phosphatase